MKRERERERCVLYDDNELGRKWMNVGFFRFAVSFLFWFEDRQKILFAFLNILKSTK